MLIILYCHNIKMKQKKIIMTVIVILFLFILGMYFFKPIKKAIGTALGKEVAFNITCVEGSASFINTDYVKSGENYKSVDGTIIVKPFANSDGTGFNVCGASASSTTAKCDSQHRLAYIEADSKGNLIFGKSVLYWVGSSKTNMGFLGKGDDHGHNGC
jgi:hypothetical protein